MILDIRNFKEEEFYCPCAKCGGSKVQPRLQNVLLVKLQAFRYVVNRPVYITSGYRCSDHNKAVGGAEHSFHKTGDAVDITLSKPDMFNREKFRLVKIAVELGFNGIGIYKNHLHLDVGFKRNKIWGSKDDS